MASLSLLLVVVGVLLSAVRVDAHGIATAMVVFPTGTFYKGYNPSYQYEHPPPTVVGWSTPNDLQYVIVYGKQTDKYRATPAGAEAPVNAGDVVEIQWTPWPASHKGPVLDYLANCNGPCETVDKTKLNFFKIDEVGLVDPAADVWGATQLMNNNNSWLVRIPTTIAPGNYVLRHEIIALHAAGQPNGAQNYPFCLSIAVSSNGTDNPSGVPGTKLYKADDPGIHFDLFGPRSGGYQIPGPTLYSGALSVVQSKGGPIKATASGIASLVEAPKLTAVALQQADSATGQACDCHSSEVAEEGRDTSAVGQPAQSFMDSYPIVWKRVTL
ncbi:hypothetical protein VTK73DRAFT_5615 [Phialemonium thermophilum]|uniref:lytic cellulose monooxygenase (C4-dehydrogenating) n=1 Tax=Phialemonium thermophilum TaxID=223376 RepID=A0ABR3WMF9_9PEZI